MTMQTISLVAPALLADLTLAGDGAATEWPICAPRDLRATHGVNITLAHLEEAAAAYDPAIEAAAINFDHVREGDAHGWLGPGAFVRDGVLWARPVELSAELVDKVKTGRVRRPSAEFATKHEVTGGWYLTGLALLGAQRAAIKGLEVRLTAHPEGPRRTYVCLSGVYRLSDIPASAATADAPNPTDQPKEVEESAPAPPPPPPIPDPGATPTAPATTDAAPADEETDMPAPTTTATPPAPPTPAAAPTTTTATATQTTPATPPTVAAAAPADPTQADLAARVARMEGRERQIDETFLRARRREAGTEVDDALRTLGSRVTPGMRRSGLRELLIELRAAETPASITLAAQGATPAREATQYDVILAALAAVPEFTALGQTPLATSALDAAARLAVDPRSADERAFDLSQGVTDEQYLSALARHPRMLTPPIGLH